MAGMIIDNNRMVQRKRPRSSSAAIALLSMAVVASILYLQLTTNDNEQLFFDRRYLSADDKLYNGGGALIRSVVTDSTGMAALHKISHSNANSEEEYNAAFAAAWSSQESGYHNTFDEPSSQTQTLQIQPYTLEDTLNESQAFNSAYTILIYNPPTDNFYAYYSNNHQMKSNNKKTFKMIRYVTYMLRQTFPERFTKDQPELVLALASGDYPDVYRRSIPRHGVAPVLMFGSAFRDTINNNLYSNMVAMPMPAQHHLVCFKDWIEFDGRVCDALKPSRGDGNANDAGLVFGDASLEWGDLIVSAD